MGISGGLALLARPVAQLLWRVVLVDPPDGFLFVPDFFDLPGVEKFEHFFQRTGRREEAIGRIVRGEEGPDLFREGFAEPFEEVPVGEVLLPRRPQLLVFGVVREVEHEPVGLGTAADHLVRT